MNNVIRNITVEKDNFSDQYDSLFWSPLPFPKEERLLARPRVVMEGTTLLDQIVSRKVKLLLVSADKQVSVGPLRLVPDCTSSSLDYDTVDVMVSRVETKRIKDVPFGVLPELDSTFTHNTIGGVLQFVKYWVAGNADRDYRVSLCTIQFQRAYIADDLKDADKAINPVWRAAMTERQRRLDTEPEFAKWREKNERKAKDFLDSLNEKMKNGGIINQPFPTII